MDRRVKHLVDLGAVVQKVQPGHKALACSRATRSFQREHVGFLRSRPPAPHRISLRLAARLLRLPLKGGVIALGARASRPHTVPLVAAELECDAAGSHPVGGNRIGQAEGEAWRRSRLIQVGEMAEAVPGFVRAGRPRSQVSLHPMTSSDQGHKIVEAFWCPLSLKEVHLYWCIFVSIRGCSSLMIGRFSSNDPHGGAGARLTAISKPWPTLSPGLA